MLNDFLSKVARERPTPIRLEEIEFKGKPMEGEVMPASIRPTVT
jgi:hypothetical protein